VIVEHTERRARVLRVGKIQKIFDNRAVAAKAQIPDRPRLRHLVNQKDAARHQQIRDFPQNITFLHNQNETTKTRRTQSKIKAGETE
jgi:hypothetical protein